MARVTVFLALRTGLPQPGCAHRWLLAGREKPPPRWGTRAAAQKPVSCRPRRSPACGLQVPAGPAPRRTRGGACSRAPTECQAGAGAGGVRVVHWPSCASVGQPRPVQALPRRARAWLPPARASGPAGPRGASCGRRRAAGRKMMKFRFRRQGADPQREKLKQELFAFHKVRRRAGGSWLGAGAWPEPRRAGGGGARRAGPGRPAPLRPSRAPASLPSASPAHVSAPRTSLPSPRGASPPPCGSQLSLWFHSLPLYLFLGDLGAPARPLGPICFAFAPRLLGRSAEWGQMLGGGAGKSLPGSSSLPPLPGTPA